MRKVQFGKICASLRREQINPATGKIWSQADLAEATRLAPKLIGQIERGEKVKLYEETLDALASAFGLTSAERMRFFSMATGIARDNLLREGRSSAAAARRIIERLETIRQPVLLHDGLYRIIALNSAYQTIYGVTQSYLDSIPDDDPTKYHIVRHIHDPESPVRAAYLNRITQVEQNNAMYWRYLSLIHRHDSLFADVQARLLQRYSTFARAWQLLKYRLEEDDLDSYLRSFKHRHPTLGQLQYLVISTPLYAGEREVFMASLMPTNERTFSQFNQLVDSAAFTTRQFNAVIATLSNSDSER